MPEQKYDREEMYNWIIQYRIDNNGRIPTRREIKDHFEVSSTSVVDNIIKKDLVHMGIYFTARGRHNGLATPGVFIPDEEWLAGLYPGIDRPDHRVLKYLMDREYFT